MSKPDIVERLQACADDPMWAHHAEIPKKWCAEAAAEITRLRAAISAPPAVPPVPPNDWLQAIADRMPTHPWGIGSRRSEAFAFARAVLAASQPPAAQPESAQPVPATKE